MLYSHAGDNNQVFRSDSIGMRGCLWIFLGCILSTGCLFKQKQQTVQNPLVSFLVPDQPGWIGKPFKVPEGKSSIVLVNFWASWCAPCREETPSLLRLVRDRGGEVVLVSISADASRGEAKKFIALFPLFQSDHVYTAFDLSREWLTAYSVQGYPETFVYDRSRKFLKRFQGAVDFGSKEFTTLLR